MAGTIVLSGASSLGSELQNILLADDIQPGSEISYSLAKSVYVFHPLGAKLVETPIKIAQSKPRSITIDNSPEKLVKEAFVRKWHELRCDYYVRGTMYQARIYGAGVLICGSVDRPTDEPIDLWKLSEQELYFSVFDTLNVAGSLVLNQNPNSPMFLKHGDISSSGQRYHRSRSRVMYNEQPVYLSYTSSAFGFNGRSVYQRALFPLKSFIQTMVTDDMVSRKAGLIVAALRQVGAAVNWLQERFAGLKRMLLKEASTDNVLSIEIDETISSINLENIDKAMITARSNIVKNIATACDMPAQILEHESFAEGFGEGTEDTKNVMRYVDGVRDEMQPLYDFLDPIVMHCAWTEEFFEAVKAENPGLYDGRKYREVFYEWKNNFKATWPSLLEEPPSKMAELEKVKLEGLVAACDMFSFITEPQAKVDFYQSVLDNLNELKLLFRVGFTIDLEAVRDQLQTELDRRKEMEDAGMANEAAAAGGQPGPGEGAPGDVKNNKGTGKPSASIRAVK